MILSEDNRDVGMKALAGALLLYFDILDNDGISNDETACLDRIKLFNGLDFLDVEVSFKYQTSIDQQFLREAAVIFLLCDLNDRICESTENNDWLLWPITKKILAAYEAGKLTAIPETEKLFSLLPKNQDDEFDFSPYRRVLDEIYEKYVYGRFANMLK